MPRVPPRQLAASHGRRAAAALSRVRGVKSLWLKHDAHFGEHPKTLKLRRLAGRHADAAEVGWWRIVEGAKRYGEWAFEDEEHLAHVAGAYVRYVDLYRQVGLLDDLTIHNAEEYQAPASGAERTAKHRSARNVDVVTPVTPREEKSRTEKSRERASGLPHLTDDVNAAWAKACGVFVIGSGDFAARLIDDVCRRHPEAAVIRAITDARAAYTTIPSTQQLAVGVRGILDPLPTGKDAQRAASEDREAIRSRRAVQATKRQAHDTGWHFDTPDPMCDACKAVA